MDTVQKGLTASDRLGPADGRLRGRGAAPGAGVRPVRIRICYLSPVPTSIKPIFLLADSQLLFWRDEEGHRFLDRARTLIDADEPPAGR